MNNSENNSANSKSNTPEDEDAAAAVASIKATNQRHLREFNEWLSRWINYQGLLAKYWKMRVQHERQSAVLPAVGEDGVSSLDRWELRFQELCFYKNEYGNCDVPTGFVYKYKPPLGNWVRKMRSLWKKEKLDPEKINRLNEIGFPFVQRTTSTIKFSVNWHESFVQLRAYKEEHGNLEVPPNYTMPSGKKLDVWMNRQRRLFREGQLPGALINKLEKLDFNLRGRGRPYGLDSAAWEEKYKELHAYYRRHGNCDVPEVYEPNVALGVWVKSQRDLFEAEALTEHRINKLTELGFDFMQEKTAEPSTSDSWETRILELQAFYEAHGHASVPRSYPLNQSLGNWCREQRLAKAEGKLTERQIKSLEDLGFEFFTKVVKSQKENVWDTKFAELIKYKKENPHCNFKNKNVAAKNPEVADWLQKQRRCYSDGVLKPEKSDRLRELGVVFKEKQIRKPVPWQAMYLSLVEYKNENGNFKVPADYSDRRLYQWVGNQRAAYRNNQLSENHFQLLSSIGFDFAPREKSTKPVPPPANTGKKPRRGNGFLNPEQFDHHFSKLLEYKEDYGNTNVPQRYKQDRLGAFVHYMRIYQKKGKLNSSYASRLKEIGFDFDVQESLWNAKCKELAAYKQTHGHFFVTCTENTSLHQWKNSQIRRRREGTLTADQTTKLLSIGFDFVKDAKTPPKKVHCPAAEIHVMPSTIGEPPVSREQYLQELWDSNYDKLAAIYEKQGNCDIPIKYEDDPSLGAWCFSQKMAKKKNKLSEDRVDRLAKLNFKF